MQESYLQNLFAERIGGARYGKDTAIYKFEKIKRAKRAAMQAQPRRRSSFDLGVGEPDEMADPGIIETLLRGSEEARESRLCRQRRRGAKKAAANYLRNVCGVTVDKPETQIVHSIGSKAALSILPAALINPGDVVLDDRAGLPGFRHAREILRRRKCTTCRCWRRTTSCPI